MSTSPPLTNNAPTAQSGNCTSSTYSVSTAPTLLSWTPSTYYPHSPSTVGRGSTTPPPPSAKAPDAIFLKIKLYFNGIGPFKILAESPAPASAVPDGRPLHDKLLYFDLPVRHARTRLQTSRLRPPLQTMPELRRHSRHTKAPSD